MTRGWASLINNPRWGRYCRRCRAASPTPASEGDRSCERSSRGLKVQSTCVRCGLAALGPGVSARCILSRCYLSRSRTPPQRAGGWTGVLAAAAAAAAGEARMGTYSCCCPLGPGKPLIGTGLASLWIVPYAVPLRLWPRITLRPGTTTCWLPTAAALWGEGQRRPQPESKSWETDVPQPSVPVTDGLMRKNAGGHLGHVMAPWGHRSLR